MLESLSSLSAHARDICHASNVLADDRAIGTQLLERVDLYALISLGVVHELVEGVIAEVKIGRASNAIRLARHLMELDLESSWIAKDPVPRIRRRIAEEYRNAIERSDGARDAVSPEVYADMEAFLHEVKVETGTLGKKGRDAGLVPSFRKIAEEMEAVGEYDQHYAMLSWLSHPGFVLAYRSVRPRRDGDRIAIDFSTDYDDVLLPLRFAANSTARCIGRFGDLLDVPPSEDLLKLIEFVALQLRTTRERGSFDDPVMMAALDRFNRDLPSMGRDEALRQLSHLTEEQRADFERLIDALSPPASSQGQEDPP